MNIYILQGLPGSGKTTWARNKKESAKSVNHQVDIVSADDFFTDSDGRYVFRPTDLGLAHGKCLRKFVVSCWEGLQEPCYTIIVGAWRAR